MKTSKPFTHGLLDTSSLLLDTTYLIALKYMNLSPKKYKTAPSLNLKIKPQNLLQPWSDKKKNYSTSLNSLMINLKILPRKIKNALIKNSYGKLISIYITIRKIQKLLIWRCKLSKKLGTTLLILPSILSNIFMTPPKHAALTSKIILVASKRLSNVIKTTLKSIWIKSDSLFHALIFTAPEITVKGLKHLYN